MSKDRRLDTTLVERGTLPTRPAVTAEELAEVKSLALAALSMHFLKGHPACRCGMYATREVTTKHSVRGQLVHYTCDKCEPIGAGENAMTIREEPVAKAETARNINLVIERAGK